MRIHSSPVLFQIKIAVFGYVSAGKSTFINSLLRDKYSEVSMGRTTAGVNYFCLSLRQGKGKGKRKKAFSNATESSAQENEQCTGNGGEPSTPKATRQEVAAKIKSVRDTTGDEESMDGRDTDEYRSAESTLREITADNAAFRESSEIHVKTFDIQIDEPLCEICDDTELVLVDIPGINEAGAGCKYRAYVTEKWDTFDCAIIVMDGRQGANTEEQVDLLKFVQNNNAEKKDIPVIILCNKVDDPDDDEQAELVKEAREEVERIFKAPDREDALNQIVGSTVSKKSNTCRSRKPKVPLFPAFIPTSAVLAYIYRSATLLTLRQFKKFDKNLIEKLGRKEVGWKWSKMPQDQKFRIAHEAVSDPSLYQERIGATNFDKIMKVLAFAVGGADVQLQLIQKQIDVSLRSLASGKDVVSQIRVLKVLGQPVEDLQTAFWKTYDSCEKSAFGFLSKSPLRVDSLALPLKELVDYYKFASSKGWKVQQALTLDRMKEFVRRQIATVLDKERRAKADWVNCEAKNSVDWCSLHPVDWTSICRSLLLLSYDKQFCGLFGREKMVLETLASKWLKNAQESPDYGNCTKCPNAKLDFNHFCASCKTFFMPEGCEDLFFEDKCTNCGKTSGPSNPSGYGRQACVYCSHCGRNFYSQSFHTSTCPSLKNPSLQLLCSVCSGPLSVNHRCGPCDIIFYSKGSSASNNCTLCGRGWKNSDGRCGNQACKSVAWKEMSCSLDELLSLKYDSDGTFTPEHPETYKSVVHLDVPQSLSDPKHYGHVAWLYCQFMASLDE